MRFKVAVVGLLLIALFPALVTGVAQETVRAILQAIMNLVGGHGG
jgi:hypothetical protein